eukprot:gnl/Hemi2/15454_TR5197_c0_g1_i1.p1 gnl/Hemi2/15454_TR5197_c0_g1~~gnl/Hemi2/15454_TR5197_c0_g1_i1.p1  ORF type:complete len:707 (-),score=213.56 gnl/Hemi2/15454_TR5197_c0_g1_i1:56-2176(-)
MDEPAAGQIMASFALFDANNVPPKPKLRPPTKRCTLEIQAVGLRNLVPFKTNGLRNPRVEFDVDSGEKNAAKDKKATKESASPNPTSPNYLEVIHMSVKVPVRQEDMQFAPYLNISVKDKTILMNEVVVGTASINLGQWLPNSGVSMAERRKDDLPPKGRDINEFLANKGAEKKKEKRKKKEEMNMEDITVVIDKFHNQKTKEGFKLDECNDVVYPQLAFATSHDHQQVDPDEDDSPIAEVEAVVLTPTESSSRNTKDEKEEKTNHIEELERLLLDDANAFITKDLWRGQSRALSFLEKVSGFKTEKAKINVGKFKFALKIYEEGAPVDKNFTQASLQKWFAPTELQIIAYVIRGHSLATKETGGECHPYLYFKVADEKGFWSMHRQDAKLGIDPEFYDTFPLRFRIPDHSTLEIQVLDCSPISPQFDELIGSTVIDVESRWFSQQWQGMKKKPVEFRGLWNPISAPEQGKLEMFLEIYDKDKAPTTATNRPEMHRPQEKNFVVRSVIYNLNGVKQAGRKTEFNFYVKMLCNGEERSTDTHFRSDNGEGEFNFRLVIDNIVWPAQNAKLKFQVWDGISVIPNDVVGEFIVNIAPALSRLHANTTDHIDYAKTKYAFHHPNQVDPTAYVFLDICVCTEAYHNANEVQPGNSGLEPPHRPKNYPFWQLDKLLPDMWREYKSRVIIFLVCFVLGIVGLVLALKFAAHVF